MEERMGRFLIISLVLVTSLVSCAHRAPSLRMLDMRSNYAEMELKDGAKIDGPTNVDGSGLTRKLPKTQVAYIHPTEMPTHDYFLGGWVKLLIEEYTWGYEEASADKVGVFVKKDEIKNKTKKKK